jgi:hypothetical protein
MSDTRAILRVAWRVALKGDPYDGTSERGT